MKFLVTASILALLMTPGFAQSTTSASPQKSQTDQSSTNGNHPQTAAAAEKLKQTLESQGFTDVKVVAQSFVVQGKSPDGDPVLMTIGPHGMSVFEAMNAAGSGETTGSASNSSAGTNGSSSSSTTPSAKSNSQVQR
jgi:hypothetical protein